MKEERVKPPLGQKVWTKPPQGWTKLNVDAAYDRSSGEANIGIVMRDYSGEVLLSAWKHGIRCASVEDAEVVAGLEGVQLSNEWIRKLIMIESDCHSVVKSLLFDDENRASFSNTVKEIKSAMSAIAEVKVCKIRRECNKVAHELAQLAKRCMPNYIHPGAGTWYWLRSSQAR